LSRFRLASMSSMRARNTSMAAAYTTQLTDPRSWSIFAWRQHREACVNIHRRSAKLLR
jgi:hypothetical protein